MQIKDYEEKSMDKNNTIEKDIQKMTQIKSEYNNQIPSGYLPIELSTIGSFNTPTKIWIKNFSTEDTLHLSMASDDLLPDYLISVLNKNIWSNEPINVALWTEKQIVELLLKIYANFYNSKIENVPFPILEEDIEFLTKDEKSNKDLLKKLEEGWKPTTDINLSNIEFYDLDKPLKSSIRIKAKDGFSVVFSVPRFGDSLALKKIVKEKYFNTDMQYDKMKKLLEEQNSSVTYEQSVEMNQYFLEKTLYITQLTKTFYLKEVNGVSLEDKSLEEKIALCNNPRIDFNLYKKYEKELGKLEYGIKPEIKVLNPLTKKSCSRRFVFRPSYLLQAIFLSETDGYDVIYE